MCQVDIESKRTICDIIKERHAPFLVLCAFYRILRDASKDGKDALDLMGSVNDFLEKHSIKWDNIRQALTNKPSLTLKTSKVVKKSKPEYEQTQPPFKR